MPTQDSMSLFTHPANSFVSIMSQVQGQSPEIMGRKKYGPCTKAAQNLATCQKGEQEYHVMCFLQEKDSYSAVTEKGYFRFV